MTDKSVREILETYGLEDKTEDVIELVHKATSEGVQRKKAAPVTVIHVIHKNTEYTWYEICDNLGVDGNAMLKQRQVLIRTNIITDKLTRPSNMCQGGPSTLLAAIENSNSDDVFDGTRPSNWVAAATHIDEYIQLRETPKKTIASQFGTTTETITKLAGELVSFSSFDRAYSSHTIEGSLSAMLSARRYSIGNLRFTLNDTSKSVRKRIRDVERKSENTVKSEDFHGTEFYWIEGDANM